VATPTTSAGSTPLPDEKAGRLPAAVMQYARNGKVRGVPALTDGRSALFYNTAMVAAAGVDRRP